MIHSRSEIQWTVEDSVRETHRKYLYSEEGDGSLAGELKEEHEDEDDKEGVEDWLLENISELKLLIAQHFRHFFVQSHEGVEVVLMES